jgi:hypothetical protein
MSVKCARALRFLGHREFRLRLLATGRRPPSVFSLFLHPSLMVPWARRPGAALSSRVSRHQLPFKLFGLGPGPCIPLYPPTTHPGPACALPGPARPGVPSLSTVTVTRTVAAALRTGPWPGPVRAGPSSPAPRIHDASPGPALGLELERRGGRAGAGAAARARRTPPHRGRR